MQLLGQSKEYARPNFYHLQFRGSTTFTNVAIRAAIQIEEAFTRKQVNLVAAFVRTRLKTAAAHQNLSSFGETAVRENQPRSHERRHEL